MIVINTLALNVRNQLVTYQELWQPGRSRPFAAAVARGLHFHPVHESSRIDETTVESRRIHPVFRPDQERFVSLKVLSHWTHAAEQVEKLSA